MQSSHRFIFLSHASSSNFSSLTSHWFTQIILSCRFRLPSPRHLDSSLFLSFPLWFSSATLVVESERALPSSLLFCVYPITIQMHCKCPFLFCRFKNFSPETLVTFLLRLFSHQITLYAFMTFLNTSTTAVTNEKPLNEVGSSIHSVSPRK